MHFSAKVLLVVATLLGSVCLPVFTFRVKTKWNVFRNDPPSNFSRTLAYAKNACVFDRPHILKAACDSSAFTCEEIIRFASFDFVDWGPSRWTDNVMLFAEGRANRGCILNPANAKSIVDSFEERWDRQWSFHTNDVHEINHGRLTQAFIADNGLLEPAQGVGSPPMRLETGLRSDKDMDKLLIELKQMMPDNLFYVMPNKVFSGWLKQIRAQGEQFSGHQLLTFVYALPMGLGFSRAVSILLEYLEQYVMGVTCKEMTTILKLSSRFDTEVLTRHEYRIVSLAALKSNIIDGYNKAAIVADPIVNHVGDVAEAMEKVLRDVGVGLPPQNNPIFGVVKGNPVIFVVDESDSMDVNFTLGSNIFVRRTFCHSQLEMVLRTLPNGTYFNVIQYSSSAVKIFQNPVLVSKTSIDAAINKVSSTWRDDYTAEKDPVEWLRKVRGFASKFKHQLNGSSTKSMAALQMAYAMADLPSQKTEDVQHTPHDQGALIVTKHLPQIYFLTSGLPDGGAGQILDKIDQLNNGRNIPVNSITFSNAFADPLTKQFGKDLANKTGGFFRSIEQA